MFMSVKREKGHYAVFIPVSFTKATVALNNGGKGEKWTFRSYEYLVLFIRKL